jgi:hypothetical protein
MKRIATLAMLLMIPAVALAAEVTGTWSGKTSTSKGDFPITFTVKATGNNLEGTMLGTDGTPFTIENGKIEGGTLTFSVTLNYPGNRCLDITKES